MKRRRKVKLKRKSWVFIYIFIFIVSTIIGINIFHKNKVPIINNTTELKSNVEIYPIKEKKISIVMVGDCLIHPPIYVDAYKNGKYDFKPMLTYIKPIISKYDLAYYNQESILAGTKNFKVSGYPQFNSPQEVGDAFLDAGFNLVSLANNHTLDKYEKGVKSSVEYWRSKNVYWTGQALSEDERTKNIKVEEKNGIKYAFLSYTTQTNGTECKIVLNENTKELYNDEGLLTVENTDTGEVFKINLCELIPDHYFSFILPKSLEKDYENLL